MNSLLEHGCSGIDLRVLRSSLLVLLTLAGTACSTRGSDGSSNPTLLQGQPEVDQRRAAPVFGRATELIDAQSRTCDRREYVLDAEAIAAAVGRTPEQLAADVDVRYASVLRWATLVPPFDGAGTQEQLDVALTYNGTARLYPNCSNLVELDMQLQLNSQSGALGFDGPATVSYNENREYRAQAILRAADMPEWQAALEPITLQEPVEFMFELALSESGSGAFLVRGPEGAMCPLANWPAQRLCDLGEHAILPDETFLGLRTNDLILGVQELNRLHAIQWEDTAAGARMTVDFTPHDSGIGCVLPAGMGVDGQRQFEVSLPGSVRLTTDDGRLDVTLPTRARTRGSEAGWSNIELFTSSIVAPDAEWGVLPAEPSSPGERAVISFSSPQPPITRQSTRLRGGVDVYTVALRSAQAQPATSSCIAGNFMGVVSPEVTAAAYISAEP